MTETQLTGKLVPKTKNEKASEAGLHGSERKIDRLKRKSRVKHKVTAKALDTAMKNAEQFLTRLPIKEGISLANFLIYRRELLHEWFAYIICAFSIIVFLAIAIWTLKQNWVNRVSRDTALDHSFKDS